MDLFKNHNEFKIQKALFSVLKEFYSIDGLWLEIDNISIDYVVCDKKVKPIISLGLKYGRYYGEHTEKQELLGFEKNYVLKDITKKPNINFLKGRFFEHLIND